MILASCDEILKKDEFHDGKLLRKLDASPCILCNQQISYSAKIL